MSKTKTNQVLRSLRVKNTATANEMILPNTSGDHVRGIKRQVPIDAMDLVNKEFVDSNFASHEGDTDAHHSKSHNVASHSDTSATGAELNTLTDDSMADTLHRHSELSASDGTPNPAVRVSASGNVGIGVTTPQEKTQIKTAGGNTLQYALMCQNPHGTANNTATGICFATEVDGYTHGKGGIIYERKAGWGVGSIHFLQNSTANASTAALADVVMTIENSGRVGIGTTTPAGVIDLTSTTGGFIVPRMTAVQVAALTPVNGMIVYDTTNNKFQFYENGSWVSGSGLV